MNLNDLLERVRLRLAGAPATDELLKEIILECQDKAATYLWREKLPESAASAIVKWAVAEFNAMGAEGQTAHQEGSVSVSFQTIPEDVLMELRCLRRGGIGANAVTMP